jgi:proteic killer suppression protein
LLQIGKGVEKFFRTGSKAGIQARHADRLRLQLAMLDNARKPEDMNAPGWRLHPLRSNLKGHWAVTVSGNWRLTSALTAKTQSWSIIRTITERRASCVCTTRRIPAKLSANTWERPALRLRLRT